MKNKDQREIKDKTKTVSMRCWAQKPDLCCSLVPSNSSMYRIKYRNSNISYVYLLNCKLWSQWADMLSLSHSLIYFHCHDIQAGAWERTVWHLLLSFYNTRVQCGIFNTGTGSVLIISRHPQPKIGIRSDLDQVWPGSDWSQLWFIQDKMKQDFKWTAY